MLPRLAVYRHKSGRRHVTLVDGDQYKPVCVRNPMKNGRPVDDTPNCDACIRGGWTRNFVMGHGHNLHGGEYTSVASLGGGLG